MKLKKKERKSLIPKADYLGGGKCKIEKSVAKLIKREKKQDTNYQYQK